ncbi:MAG: SCO family protein [Planctomycetes bacterium]|nr:SCO family protein [Planctomycetota bacterium]
MSTRSRTTGPTRPAARPDAGARPALVAGALALAALLAGCTSKAEPSEARADDAAAPAACCELPEEHLDDAASGTILADGEHGAAAQKAASRDDDDEADEDDDDAEVARLAAFFGADEGPAQVDDGTGLPVHGLLPDFELVDDDGKAFTRADMRGQVWVVDFIFTRCSGPCPEMSSIFAQLAREGLAAKLLSITVDPGYDEPGVLAGYRKRYGTGKEQWRLLTGTSDGIQSLADSGFKLPVNARGTEVAGMPPMFHSGRFALVDAEGRVRGYYAYNDQAKLRELKDDAQKLAALAAQ